MARILSNETSLSRQQARLRREARLLHALRWLESGLAALLLAGGGVAWALGRGSGWFWSGFVLAFLAFGHRLKVAQNARDEQYLAAGLRGENQVAKILNERLDQSYFLFNDLQIRSGFNRAQIDHVVVHAKGIFVIETKNWGGRLSGDENARKWMQYRSPDQPPRALANPIQQNRRHAAVLEKFLRTGGVPELPIIPMLVFTGRHTTLDIRNTQALLFWPLEAVDYILRYSPARLASEAEVDAVLHRLQRCV